MNGAEILLSQAFANGITVCFANPGTTEISIVSAFDKFPQIRPVLCLFEGVATGAADGYFRMARKPALTLTHLGPSFSNGLANLHNAKRARSGIVNIVGDQPTWHGKYDTPMKLDIEGVARAVSAWARTASSAGKLGAEITEAISHSLKHNGQVCTLIVPADHQWESVGGFSPLSIQESSPPQFDSALVEKAARMIGSGSKTAIIAGGTGLSEEGLRGLGTIANDKGTALFCESFPARLELGGDLPSIKRLPYVREFVRSAFSGFQYVILIGADTPVAFFGIENGQSHLLPDQIETLHMVSPTANVVGAIQALCESLGLRVTKIESRGQITPPTGELNGKSLAHAIAACQPDNAIFIDEGVSIAGTYLQAPRAPGRHSYLSLTGGACGFGLPCSIGAAMACPDRRVIALVGDGSATYTVQALWTQANQGLNVTNVICSNNAYRILQLELQRGNSSDAGPQALKLTDISKPELNWKSIAKGYGIPSKQVNDLDSFIAALRWSFSEQGPSLIQVGT
jgi:acetolactate synthase-1/2/3 large subunit